MWVGLVIVRVTELWIPPRPPVTSEPGVFTIFSWAWYMKMVPSRIRCETTARAVSAPFALYASTQSLSSMPARSASASDSHTTGPPRFRVSMRRLSEYVEWMPHFWCGVMKFSTNRGRPSPPSSSMSATGAMVLVSMGGRYAGSASPKARIQRWSW